MDPALTSLLTTYGPLALGWVLAFYLGKFILDRYDNDIKAKLELAEAITALAKSVEERKTTFERIEDALTELDRTRRQP